MKRSHTAVSNLRNAVEEGKKRLATLLEKKALGVYVALCAYRLDSSNQIAL